MDNNQTSFIPRREIYTKREKQPSAIRYSPVFVITFVLLICSILLSTGVFIYKQVLVKRITEINAKLVAEKNAFEPKLIEELVKTDSNIEALKSLLSEKVSLLLVFSLLEKETLENIRFLSFKYALTPEGVPTLDLEGEALSPATIALQSDVFNTDPKIIKPTFSGLSIAENGTAKFNFHGDLDKKHFLFNDLVNPQSEKENNGNGTDVNNSADSINNIGVPTN